MSTTGVLSSLWFRLGLLISLLILIGIKFWMTRRKYLRQQQQEAAIIAEQNSRAIRHSFLLVESDLRERELNGFLIRNHGRNVSNNPPPPEFDDAIKNFKKVERQQQEQEYEHQDYEQPPSYNDYIKSVSNSSPTNDDDNDDNLPPSIHQAEGISTIVISSAQNEKECFNIKESLSLGTNPADVENHL